jgi:hypothetical protein
VYPVYLCSWCDLGEVAYLRPFVASRYNEPPSFLRACGFCLLSDGHTRDLLSDELVDRGSFLGCGIR